MKYNIALFVTLCVVLVAAPAFARDMESSESEFRRMESRGEKHGMENSDDRMMGEHMMKKGGRKAELTAEQVSCVKTAVGVREGAVSSAFTTFSSSVSSALSVRAAALATAWNFASTTERAPAIRAAWKTYSESIRSARTSLRESKKTAWNTFKESAKTCKVEAGATGDNPGLDQQ